MKTYPRAAARTLRDLGTGLSDLGDGLTWGEAYLLLTDAMEDTSTRLGADVAGWAYPASLKDVLMLAATIRDKEASRTSMPWAPELTGRVNAPSVDEVAAAQAELEAGIVFS